MRDDSVIALACNGSPVATSTPELCGNGVSAGTASATTAEEAVTIRAAAAAVSGATLATRRATCAAGTASTTASACHCSPVSSRNIQPGSSASILARTHRTWLRATSSSSSTW